MRMLVRAFFKSLRLVLGPFMLAWEALSRPKGIRRPAERQREVDRACADLVLYQFRTCPFCIKVRQELCRLSLNVVRLDAQPPGQARDELLAGGGSVKVPCLRIGDTRTGYRWLYESDRIIEYLRGRFAGHDHD
jgi:glutaredoxin